MHNYELQVRREVSTWRVAMLRRPGYFNRLAKKLQNKINKITPEKVHAAITTTLKQMFRAVLWGSKITTASARTEGSLELREAVAAEKIKFYKHTAAAEGGK